MLLLHYALKLQTIDFENVGVEIVMPKTLEHGFAVRFEIGGPEGTCTLSLPADNGLLL